MHAWCSQPVAGLGCTSIQGMHTCRSRRACLQPAGATRWGLPAAYGGPLAREGPACSLRRACLQPAGAQPSLGSSILSRTDSLVGLLLRLLLLLLLLLLVPAGAVPLGRMPLRLRQLGGGGRGAGDSGPARSR